MNTEKKQWVAPLATEMEVNGGTIGFLNESATFIGPTFHGSIS
jgi:hypothetical protein